MFIVGGHVSYPMHGVGVIEAIEERTVLGRISRYYVLRFLIGGAKVMVPVESVETVHLRELIAVEDAERVEKLFLDAEYEEDANWNRRYRENLDKMRTGDIFELAEVVKRLWLREKERGLSAGDKKMLNNARTLLIGELALVKQCSEDEVFTALNPCVG